MIKLSARGKLGAREELGARDDLGKVVQSPAPKT